MQRLSDLKPGEIIIDCACGRQEIVGAGTFRQMVGQDASFREVLPRLKCIACKERGAQTLTWQNIGWEGAWAVVKREAIVLARRAPAALSYSPSRPG